MNNIIPLFSVPVYKNTIQNLDLSIFKNYKFHRIKNPNNGFMSEDKYVLDNKELLVVKHCIEEHIKVYVNEILRINENIEFIITNSWLTLHHKGDWAHKHNHKNSLLSGILYLNVDDQSGNLVFHCDDRKSIFNQLFEFNTFDYNVLNSGCWIEKPKNMDLFIFPSFLDHSVSESFSDNDRLALVFNVFIKGKLGSSILSNELFL